MKPMYYIQNYDHKTGVKNISDTTSRFLSPHYMGSAEFEFGSVGASWSFLRENNIKLFSTTVLGKNSKEEKEIQFFVITTEEGFERFKENIEIHLDGQHIGQITKDYTGIYYKFFTEHRAQKFADAWLDVSCFVGGQTGDAIFFTDSKEVALRTFLELKRQTTPEINVFDEVFSYKSDGSFKVCGLNEDDSISAKQKYGKAIKFNPNDLWLKENLVDLQINESIMDETLRFNI